VIAGHGRVLAATELGSSEVPTIAIEHFDAAQRRVFAIADNRLTENSAWNDQLLAEQLKEFSTSISISRPASTWARSTSGSRAWT